MLAGRSTHPLAANLERIAVATGYRPEWLAFGQGSPRATVAEHRFASLELLVKRNPGRWLPGAVVEAEDQARAYDDDPGAEHWADVLDRADAVLRALRRPALRRG